MANEIPIIGAPRINAWFVTVQVICTCAQVPMLIVGVLGASGQCVRCGKVYSVTSIQTNGSDVSIRLGVQNG